MDKALSFAASPSFMVLDSSFLLREDELYLIMQLPPKHELCCFIRRSGAISGSLYLNSALELVGKSNVKVFPVFPATQSGREREREVSRREEIPIFR